MPQIEWFPLFIDKLLSSPAWNLMKDYQRGWYIQLLLHCTRSERLGYLKMDSNLWTIAGAKRKDFWDAQSSIVLACFKVREMDGHQWIYNDRLLHSMEVAERLLTKQKTQSLFKEFDFDVVCKSKAKPCLEELSKYIHERGDLISADAFFDFYESKGWRVGNQPMRDWRAAVRSWERRIEGERLPKPPETQPMTEEELQFAENWNAQERARIAAKGHA
jgi:hypothetical protein